MKFVMRNYICMFPLYSGQNRILPSGFRTLFGYTNHIFNVNPEQSEFIRLLFCPAVLLPDILSLG